MLKNVNKTILSTVFVLLIIASGLYFFVGKNNSIPTYDVKKSNLKSSLELVGTVKTVRDLNLGFEVSGKVRNVNVTENEFVEKGSLLIDLENQDIIANLNQAKADLLEAKSQLFQQEKIIEIEREKLSDLQEGSTQAEINLAKASLDTSFSNLKDAELRLQQIEKDIETSIENEINSGKIRLIDTLNKSIILLYNLSDLQLQVYPTITSKSVQVAFHKANATEKLVGLANAERYDSKIISQQKGGLKEKISLDSIKTIDDISMYAYEILDSLQEINQGFAGFIFEDQVSPEVINLIDQGKSNTFQEIDKLTSLLNNLNDLERNNQSKLIIAQQAVEIANSQKIESERNLTKVQEGPQDTEIRIQERQIEQAKSLLQSKQARIQAAEARINLVQADLNKRRITAPISGWIQSVSFGSGEIVSANETAIRLIAENELLIEVDVPERHVEKLYSNPKAIIKLESLSDSFEGEVIRIDRESTLIDNTPIFKADIKIYNDNNKIRSGMTGDVEIIFEEKSDVLVVPSKLIKNDEEGSYVEVVREFKPLVIEKTYIEIGMTSNSSQIEVTNGLEQGDLIYDL